MPDGGMATPEIEQIRSDYERIWETSRRRLAGGFVDPAPLSEEGSERFSKSGNLRGEERRVEKERP